MDISAARGGRNPETAGDENSSMPNASFDRWSSSEVPRKADRLVRDAYIWTEVSKLARKWKCSALSSMYQFGMTLYDFIHIRNRPNQLGSEK